MNTDRYTVEATQVLFAGVRIRWNDGHTSLYHHIWLRDNCACPVCGTHASGSRFQMLLDITDSVAPASVKSDAASVTVVWSPDGHTSRFSGRWLREHCYSAVERARRKPRPVVWDSRLEDLPWADYASAVDDESERLKLFASVRDYGFVLLRNVGAAHDEIERIAGMIGYLRETHYGRIFDLKPRPNPKILADLPRAILPHTDETYRQVPTGINIFHCIRPSADGGGVSTLVDSLAVAARLRAQDPAAFNLLCRVPVQHERRIEGQVIRSAHPVFTRDDESAVTEVRLNERTMSALSVPEELMESTYRALRATLRIAYDPANRIHHRLEAEQALLFDNLRVLHGRTAFSGDRFLRQAQVMRDEFYAKLAALEEAPPTAHPVPLPT